MSEAKTKPTPVSAMDFVAAIEPAARRADCEALMRLMREITGEAAVMWGAQHHRFRSLPVHLREWSQR